MNFPDPEENPMVIYTDMTIHWNLEKLVNFFNQNIVRLQLYRPETNGSAERESSKKSQGALPLFYCSSDSMNSGCQNLWKSHCYLRSVQDLSSDGMNAVLKNNSVGRSFHLKRKSNIIRYLRETRRGSISSA